ncbi:MAG: VWA domain-containing protein [Campylobacterota bacterium]|nr:VWA domain-containing protein [Campylobacterota bacterium]
MNSLLESWETFHFLRPLVLLLLLPAWAFVYWLLHQQNDRRRWKKLVNPKLLEHLLLTPQQNHSKIEAPWFLGLLWTLMIVALSGPSWQLKPEPFAKDKAEVVFLIKVSPSMMTSDLTPSRLERARFKMKDFLALRSDTKAALIAYSGSSHLVLPLTADHNILTLFANSLDPEIMPKEGDDLGKALTIASKQFTTTGGTIIVLTDSSEPAIVKDMKRLEFSPQILFLAVASKELLNLQQMQKSANILNANIQEITIDDSDIEQLNAWTERSFETPQGLESSHYKDGGYLLLPLILLLLLFWFRRGFIAEVWRVS